MGGGLHHAFMKHTEIICIISLDHVCLRIYLSAFRTENDEMVKMIFSPHSCSLCQLSADYSAPPLLVHKTVTAKVGRERQLVDCSIIENIF